MRNWKKIIPDRLPSRVWIPDDGDYSVQRAQPVGIILHSGDRFEGVAEYAEHEPDGRRISYHFAWSEKHQRLVQMVGLHSRAWHAGPKWNGALGIALSGPWTQNPRREHELQDLERLMAELQEAFCGELRWVKRHSDVDASRHDPGPGVYSVSSWRAI
jgi:N-acetyl-anhydromuramyl-L-alanine amidase AmpD